MKARFATFPILLVAGCGGDAFTTAPGVQGAGGQSGAPMSGAGMSGAAGATAGTAGGTGGAAGGSGGATAKGGAAGSKSTGGSGGAGRGGKSTGGKGGGGGGGKGGGGNGGMSAGGASGGGGVGAGGLAGMAGSGGAAGQAGASGTGAGTGGNPTCGDGTKNGTEECDGSDFGASTCMSILGADVTGTVGCSPKCKVITGGCVLPCTGTWEMFGRCAHHAHRADIAGPAAADESAVFQAAAAIGAPTIGHDGTVYIPSAEGTFIALDPSTYAKKYGIVLPGATPAAVTPSGAVYVGAGTGLYSLAAPIGGKTFATVWSLTTEGAISSGITLSPDGATIYAGTMSGKLLAVNASTGVAVWTKDLGGKPIYSTPAIGPSGRLFVGSSSGSLWAVDPLKGDVAWQYDTAKAINGSPAVGANGGVYVGTLTGFLLALSAADGSLRWSLPLGIDTSSSPAIGPDGTVFIGTQGASLVAVTPEGVPKWTAPTSHWTVAAPIVDADGNVYIGSYTKADTDPAVFSYAPTGVLRWSANIGCYVAATAALTSKGTLLVPCSSGALHAFGP